MTSSVGRQQLYAPHAQPVPRPGERERSDEIVFRSHLRDFMRTAFRWLRILRESGVGLELPIIYAISGASNGVARQRFGELFLALEALHSIYLEHEGKTFLAEGVRSRNLRRQMVEKLGGLNRPALWQGIQLLMKRLRVD
jgi:hypothetical protein